MPADDGDEGEYTREDQQLQRERERERESLFYRLHATHFVSRAATNLLPFTPLMRLLCTLVESTWRRVASHFRSIRRYSTDETACLLACMYGQTVPIHPSTYRRTR